jgi:hypothetical protein
MCNWHRQTAKCRWFLCTDAVFSAGCCCPRRFTGCLLWMPRESWWACCRVETWSRQPLQCARQPASSSSSNSWSSSLWQHCGRQRHCRLRCRQQQEAMESAGRAFVVGCLWQQVLCSSCGLAGMMSAEALYRCRRSCNGISGGRHGNACRVHGRKPPGPLTAAG